MQRKLFHYLAGIAAAGLITVTQLNDVVCRMATDVEEH